MGKKRGTPFSSRPTGRSHRSRSDKRMHATFNRYGAGGKHKGRHHEVGSGAGLLGFLFGESRKKGR